MWWLIMKLAGLVMLVPAVWFFSFIVKSSWESQKGIMLFVAIELVTIAGLQLLFGRVW